MPDTKQVEIYSVEQQKADEAAFDENIKNGKIDYSNFKRVMMRDLLNNSDLIESGYIGKVKLEDAQKAMEHPKTMWKMLLNISNALMHISPHYYRMNSLFANMALFCWWIDLYDVKDNANVDTIKTQYSKLAAKLENMHLKHEFAKIMRVLPYQDIYCGLVVESSTDFFLQKMDYKICKLQQIQDGLYNFKLNLSAIKPQELDAYPDYVQDAYVDYMEGKHPSKWYLPPADKQICIKMNSQWTYPYPILIGLVKDILDLDTYKKLKLQSARTDNYKAILVEVPIDESQIDKPLLSPDTLSIFAEINRESLSNDIGMIHTLGSKGEAISFKDSANTRNNVSDAVDELYNDSGISKELFNSGGTATAMTLSVENNAGFVYDIYRQFERWVNRYIKLRKFNKPAFKFYFYLLDITVFNRDNVSKRYKEAATLGACIDRWLASLDMTPSRMLGSNIVSNDIFDFHNTLIPLQSAYNASAATQATDEAKGGRPTAEENGEQLSDEGEATLDGDKNDR